MRKKKLRQRKNKNGKTGGSMFHDVLLNQTVHFEITIALQKKYLCYSDIP